MLVAKREIVFLDSLHPDGFRDETYRFDAVWFILRLRLKIIHWPCSRHVIWLQFLKGALFSVHQSASGYRLIV